MVCNGRLALRAAVCLQCRYHVRMASGSITIAITPPGTGWPMTMHDHFLERVSRWRRPVALAGLSLGLVGIVAFEAAQLRAIEAAAQAADAVVPRLEPIDDRLGFTLPPLSDYADVLRRPLFVEARRAPLHVAAAAEAPPLGLSLVAVVITSGERHALVQRGNPPHLDRIGEGQQIDGWTVESIQLDRVVVSRGDRRVELKVKDTSVVPDGPQGSKAPTETTPEAPFLPGAAPSKVFPGG
jgi:hypothetical protein